MFPGRLLALWRPALRRHSNGAIGTMVGCCGRGGAGSGAAGGAVAADGVVDRGGDGDASAVVSPRPAGGVATRGTACGGASVTASVTASPGRLRGNGGRVVDDVAAPLFRAAPRFGMSP